MTGWAALALSGMIVASVPVSPVAAKCENTGKTCIEARRFHQRLCARIGQSVPRQDCYATGDKAYDNCLTTGRWITQQCNLSDLGK